MYGLHGLRPAAWNTRQPDADGVLVIETAFKAVQDAHTAKATPADGVPADYEDLRQLRRTACHGWRFDLTRQQALDKLYELKGMAQDSYRTKQALATPAPTKEPKP
jgi:hypothetical protein